MTITASYSQAQLSSAYSPESSEAIGFNKAECLKILGLSSEPTSNEIDQAYKRLVADIKPGGSSKHSRVSQAMRLLAEVETAYLSLRSTRNYS